MFCYSIHNKRSGWTLTELLVVLGIVSLLCCLLFPAVQAAREAGRKATCQSKMRQICIAIQNYESTNKFYPYARDQKSFSFLVQLLPYLEQQSLYDNIDFGQTAASQANLFTKSKMPMLLCPSDGHGNEQGAEASITNYHGCAGEGLQKDGINGLISSPFLTEFGSEVRQSSVTDGLSNTAAISEALAGSAYGEKRLVFSTEFRKTSRTQYDEFANDCVALPLTSRAMGTRSSPWWSRTLSANLYNHLLNPNGRSCTNGDSITYGAYSATSAHSGGGVYVGFGDGHIEFIQSSIDLSVWRALASRSGGE